jgi:hypothetical protein
MKDIFDLLGQATDKVNHATVNSLEEYEAHCFLKGILAAMEAMGYAKKYLLDAQAVRQYLIGNGDKELVEGGLWKKKRPFH